VSRRRSAPLYTSCGVVSSAFEIWEAKAPKEEEGILIFLLPFGVFSFRIFDPFLFPDDPRSGSGFQRHPFSEPLTSTGGLLHIHSGFQPSWPPANSTEPTTAFRSSVDERRSPSDSSRGSAVFSASPALLTSGGPLGPPRGFLRSSNFWTPPDPAPRTRFSTHLGRTGRYTGGGSEGEGGSSFPPLPSWFHRRQ